MAKQRLYRTRWDDLCWYLTSLPARLATLLALGLVCVWGVSAYVIPTFNQWREPTVIATVDTDEVARQASTLAQAKTDYSRLLDQFSTHLTQLESLISQSEGWDRTRLSSCQEVARSNRDSLTSLQSFTSTTPGDYVSYARDVGERDDLVHACILDGEAYRNVYTQEQERLQAEARAQAEAEARAQAEAQAKAQAKAHERNSQPSTPAPTRPQPVPSQPRISHITVTCDRESVIKVVGNAPITVNGGSYSSGATVSGSTFSLSTSGTQLSWSWVSGGNCS